MPDHLIAELDADRGRLRAAMAVGGMGVWDYAIRTGALNWSDELYPLYGRDPAEGPPTIAQWRACLHPDDLAASWRRDESFITGETIEVEFRVRRPEGGWRWLLGRARVYGDAEGRPDSVLGINIDITERKRTEAALADEVLRRNAAQDAAGIGIHVYHVDTGVVEWDERVRAIWGVEADTPITYEVFETGLHPEDRIPVKRAVDASLARPGVPFAIEYRVISRRDGLTRWVSATGQVQFEQGRARQLVGTAQDVTDLKARAQALVLSEQRFRAAVAAVNGIMWTHAVLGEMDGPQPGWSSLTGQEQAEYQGQGWLDALHPEDVAATVAAMQTARQDRTALRMNHRVRRRDGQWRFFSVHAVPVLDQPGRTREWVGVHTDVTHAREAERRQALLVDELNHRIKNTLATVQAMAHQTLRAPHAAGDAMTLFESRLASLARAHALLTHEHWEGADLEALLRASLGLSHSDQLDLSGPPVRLPPFVALSMAMAIHELATNALKYGALSVSGGRIDIRWSLSPQADGPALLGLQWEERNGPVVTPPRRRGFGSRLIEQGLAHDLNGTATLDYRPGGLVCRMTARLPEPAGWWGEVHQISREAS